MYAIIKSGGKQYRVKTGDVIDVEKIDVEAGQKVVLNDVLSVKDGDELIVDPEKLKNCVVEAECVSHFRDKKVIVAKMKRRKGYK
ncbi:MAG: 50S ribosomal protein L21, partial [Lentisphaerae bacterium]